jgi:oligopeptidase B
LLAGVFFASVKHFDCHVSPQGKTTPKMSADPPIAHKTRTENLIHDRMLVDEYSWMCDRANPEVIRYLLAENAYAEAAMKETEPLQTRLYDEMVGHINEADISVPYREGSYYYYSRWAIGRQYPIFARKKSFDCPEETLLDVNELAEGQEFMGLGAFKLSRSGQLLAYSTDNSGFRQYRLHVRDLTSGKDLSDAAERCGYVAWADDDQTLFYTVEDDAKRSYRLFRHILGTDCTADFLVYEERDERFSIALDRSRSGRFIFLTAESQTTSEVRYLDAVNPTGEWLLPPSVKSNPRALSPAECHIMDRERNSNEAGKRQHSERWDSR